MRQTFGNSPALDKWINALNLLDTAVQNHETAHAIGFFREAIVSGKEAYEEAKKAGANSNAMDQLYHGSTAVGGLAVALVRGPAAEVVAPVAASLKIIEAGLRVKLVMEENRQFDALSDQAFQRDQEKLQLMKKQESLENQARDLQMVIQRSGGQQ
jgi:hypothetical protein